MDLTDSDLAAIADEIDADVATLQSEAVKDCAESVKADNPDMDTSQAFAICQNMENEGMLAEPHHVTLAETGQPGTIERVEQDDGSVRYRNVMLLAPGVWGDAASQRQFLYSEQTTAALADNIAATTLNLFHEQDNETTEVGSLDESSVYVGDDDGALYGDLVLSMDNAASEFADEAMQDALATGGDKGLKGPSLEIARPDHEFNADAGVPEVTDGVVTGVALVGLGVSLGPGSKDASFAEQTRERAVALSSADNATVLTRDNDMTSTTERLLGDLAAELSDEELRAVAEEHGIELQTDGEMGMVQDLISEARQEGFDPGDQSVDELRAFIGENLDPSEDAMAAFESVAGSMLDAMDADDEDSVAAADLLDWLQEQMDAEEVDDEAEAGDYSDDDGGDDEMDLARLQEQVQANAERIEALVEAQEGIELGSVASKADRVEAKADAEALETLAERVAELEDTLEAPTSLASAGGTENTDEDGDGVGPLVDFGTTDIQKTH